MATTTDNTENRASLDYQADTSKAPGLWPDIGDDRNVVVAPLLNKHQWLAMVRETQPGALSENQRNFLKSIGFTQGSNGRMFFPAYPNPKVVSQLCTVFDCQPDALRPDQVITVTPKDEFTPNIPLEVQAGVRWYWKNKPRVLIDEIKDSLRDREDELSISTLKAIESERLENMMRLQSIVGQALEGEISSITEPVLAMGLYQGTASYGPVVTDWPEDLQAFHAKLAESRGEEPPATLATDPTFAPSDPRPAVGQRCQWQGQDSVTMNGYVVGHDEDADSLWVVAQGRRGVERQQDAGFLFPKREKISRHSLLNQPAPTPEPEEAPGEPEASEPETFEPVVDENLQPQRPVTVRDAQNLALANRQPGEILSDRAKRMILSGLRLGRFMGDHPLTVEPNASPDCVISWSDALEDLSKWPTSEQYERALDDAQTFVRDTLIDWYNEAQPATPNGKRPAYAVLPAPSAFLGLTHEGMTPEIEERLAQFQICRIGINPTKLYKVEAALAQWAENEAPEIYDPNGTIVANLKSTASFIKESSLYLSHLSFSTKDRYLRTMLREVYDEVYARIAENSGGSEYDNSVATLDYLLDPDNREELRAKLPSDLFFTYEEAHSYLSGQNPQLTEVTRKNTELLRSLADITDRSQETLWKSRHPIFVALDALDAEGLTGTNNRARQLAMFNVDLSKQVHWLGQLAQMNGVQLSALHNHRLDESVSNEQKLELQKKLGLVNEPRIPFTPRAKIMTGLLTRQGETDPFQIIAIATADDLIERSLSRESVGQHTPPMLHQDDASNTSVSTLDPEVNIGRLVELNASAPIRFSDSLIRHGQVLEEEALRTLEPTVIGFEHFQQPDGLLKREGLTNVASFTSYNQLPDGMIGYTSAAKIKEAAEASRNELQTMLPSWRTNDAKRDEILSAIKLWISDFKAFSNLARPENIAQDLLHRMAKDPDTVMIMVAAKSTSRRVRYFMEPITQEDIRKSGGNRAEASEKTMLKIKARHRETNRGWKFSTFDAATVLRPEALRYLNELKQNQRIDDRTGKSDKARTDEPKRRGARQDRGKVAGLAIKDLRGKASTILATLEAADKEDQGKFVTKTKLWDTPDWTMLRNPTDEDRNNGERPMEPLVAGFFEELRKQIPARPPANIASINLIYSRYVLAIRDAFSSIRTKDELVEALKQDGRIHKIEENLESDTRANGCPHSLVSASGSGMYRDSTLEVYADVYRKAKRASMDNEVWPIKDQGPRNRFSVNADQDEKTPLGAMPMLSKLVRKGAEDYRGGTNVDEQTMIATFGFSGVEYGKSMSQKDRETYLNECYDGFLDMAKVLKVPPKALSLGGTLGLAFGSRGKGGRNAALAHFEPGNNAINLTRMKGAGSMAHEWGHALANYLFRASRGIHGSRSPGDITETLGKQIGRFNPKPLEGGQLRQAVTDAIGSVIRSMKYKPADPVKDPDNLVWTNFHRGAEIAERNYGSRSSGKTYWLSVEEMFARSFETYVNAALKAENPEFRNDFLVRPDKLRVWGDDISERRNEIRESIPEKPAFPGQDASQEAKEKYRKVHSEIRSKMMLLDSLIELYPNGDELKTIKGKFDKLFDTLETRDEEVMHEHLGKVNLPMLYSHDSGSVSQLTEKEQGVLAHCVMAEVARMCGPDVWVSWHKQLRDDQNAEVAGRYHDHRTADGKVRAVIELAYGAPMGVAHHEAFHFAQKHLINDSERTMLDREFQPGSELTERLCQALNNDGKFELAAISAKDPREAQAYAFELWVQGKLDMRIEDRPTTLFGRVRQFFDRAAGISTNAGFKTPHALFQAFHQGQLAARQKQDQAITINPEDKQDFGQTMSESSDHSSATRGNETGSNSHTMKGHASGGSEKEPQTLTAARYDFNDMEHGPGPA